MSFLGKEKKMKEIASQIEKLNSIFPWIRDRAFNKLVEIGLPAVEEIIIALDTRYAPIIKGFNSKSDSTSELRGAMQRYPKLVDILVRIGKPAIEQLEAALHHSNLNVRVSAMSILGKIGEPSITESLSSFLDSSDHCEREYAIKALGDIRSLDLLEKILSALHDEHPHVVESAIYALEKIGDTRALPDLEHMARTNTTIVDRYEPTLGELAAKAVDKIRQRGAG